MSKTTKTMNKKTETNIFDLGSVEVTLTYPFLKDAEPIKFFLRPILNSEEKASRQKFLALSEAEREQRKHEANVELLASLSTQAPENLPTFPDFNGNDVDLERLRSELREFFAGTNPMKQKVVDDALTVYFNHIQPAEFFRGF